MEPIEEKLTPRQILFIQEYLIDLNGTKAAIRAGYSEDSATVIASDLLKLTKVSQRIATAVEQRATRIGMTQAQVLHEMSLLANSRLDWFVVNDEGQVELTEAAPEGAMGCVASIKRKVKIFPGKGDTPGHKEYDVELKFWDKPAPLKLMGRHTGLFPDKVEVSGPNGKPIETVTRIERVII